jgi:hypothetical protein
VGTDIDLATHSSTHNWGDGLTSANELNVIKHAIGFVDAGASGRVIRFITSNQDIFNGIQAARPSVPLFYDTSGGHQDHLHIDVGPPTRIAGRANLAGDFNLDDVVNAQDLAVWRQYAGQSFTGNDFLTWQRQLGRSQAPMGAETVAQSVPEPQTLTLLWQLACGLAAWRRRPASFARVTLEAVSSVSATSGVTQIQNL